MGHNHITALMAAPCLGSVQQMADLYFPLQLEVRVCHWILGWLVQQNESNDIDQDDSNIKYTMWTKRRKWPLSFMICFILIINTIMISHVAVRKGRTEQKPYGCLLSDRREGRISRGWTYLSVLPPSLPHNTKECCLNRWQIPVKPRWQHLCLQYQAEYVGAVSS